MDAETLPKEPNPLPIRFGEFVTMAASLMALGSMGVDTMLPALPALMRDLHVANPNSQQYVISVYLFGLGFGQLIHGPLADRFGRRPVVIGALLVYFVANLLVATSTSFTMLLVLRAVSALGVSACRVITVTMIRDGYVGRAMSRVMSLTAMVFLIAPILAPSIGQFVLLFGTWRTIFWLTAGLTLMVLAWFTWRMPETLHPEDKRPVNFASLALGWQRLLSDRYAPGYMLAAGLLMGTMFGYLNSVQQIVSVVFGRATVVNVVFACTAAGLAGANFLNSRIVMRYGSRLLSHAALVMLILISSAALVVGGSVGETLLSFTVLQTLAMGCISLSNSNFSAIAMEDMGEIAGLASSVQGFCTTMIGTLVGAAIGQSFAGTTMPLHLGYLLCGGLALAIVAVTERGKLFRAR